MKLSNLTIGQRVFLGSSAMIVLSALAFSLVCFRRPTPEGPSVEVRSQPSPASTSERIEFAANLNLQESAATHH